MAYAIRVKAYPNDTRYLFEKNLDTQEEFQAIQNLCVSRREIGYFESYLITARTNTWENFATDFFFPTTIHHALTIHNLALKILATIDFIILDTITLPIRLITLLPRFIYNEHNSKETHAFYKYLVKQGVSAEALGDHIFLEKQWMENEGWPHRITYQKALNFIELPVGVNSAQITYYRRGVVNS
jgi:hypothetical protein